MPLPILSESAVRYPCFFFFARYVAGRIALDSLGRFASCRISLQKKNTYGMTESFSSNPFSGTGRKYFICRRARQRVNNTLDNRDNRCNKHVNLVREESMRIRDERFSHWRVIKRVRCERETTNLRRICIYRGSCYIPRVASDYRNKWRRNETLSLAWERMRDAARSGRIPKALEALDVTLLCHWPVLGGARTSWCHSNALARWHM